MRIVPIEDIKQMEDKEVIPAVQGRLKAVFEQKSQEGQYGTKTMQNGILASGSGEIGVRFENHDDLSGLKGKLIKVSCWKGDRGLSGVYVDKGEFNNKPYLKVKVTKTGTVEEAGSGGGSEGASGSGGDNPPAQANKTNPTATQTPSEGNLSPLQIRKVLNRLANFDLMCAEAASYTCDKLRESGAKITEEQFQARWSSYFIQGTRDNLHLSAPTGDMDVRLGKVAKEEPEPKKKEPSPAPEPEPEQDDGGFEGGDDDDLPF